MLTLRWSHGDGIGAQRLLMLNGESLCGKMEKLKDLFVELTKLVEKMMMMTTAMRGRN